MAKDKALEALRAVVEYSDQTTNCSVCGAEPGEHNDDCPIPLVKEAILELEAEEDD